jgi:hypothetical protein
MVEITARDYIEQIRVEGMPEAKPYELIGRAVFRLDYHLVRQFKWNSGAVGTWSCCRQPIKNNSIAAISVRNFPDVCQTCLQLSFCNTAPTKLASGRVVLGIASDIDKRGGVLAHYQRVVCGLFAVAYTLTDHLEEVYDAKAKENVLTRYEVYKIQRIEFVEPKDIPKITRIINPTVNLTAREFNEYKQYRVRPQRRNDAP